MFIFHFLLLQDSAIVLKCGGSQAEAVAGERRVERERPQAEPGCRLTAVVGINKYSYDIIN